MIRSARTSRSIRAWPKLTGIAFGTRLSVLTSLILFVNMTMAYLSVPDDRTNFLHIFSNPSDFYGATPYTYWFAALLIVIFGPGLIATDTVLGYFARRKPIPLTDERTPVPDRPR